MTMVSQSFCEYCMKYVSRYNVHSQTKNHMKSVLNVLPFSIIKNDYCELCHVLVSNPKSHMKSIRHQNLKSRKRPFIIIKKVEYSLSNSEFDSVINEICTTYEITEHSSLNYLNMNYGTEHPLSAEQRIAYDKVYEDYFKYTEGK